MLRSGSNGVCFSPDIKDRQRYSPGSTVAGNRKGISGICSFSVPKHSPTGGGFSPMRYLQHLGAKVARVLRLVSLKRKSRRRKSSSKVSSSNSTISRRPSFAPLDSYQAEAIEDCIEFINSSSSFQRSNSVSAL